MDEDCKKVASYAVEITDGDAESDWQVLATFSCKNCLEEIAGDAGFKPQSADAIVSLEDGRNYSLIEDALKESDWGMVQPVPASYLNAKEPIRE